MPRICGPLVRCLSWVCVIGLVQACAGLGAGSFEQTHAVSYPVRSPEYLRRDLGDKRFLLGQWVRPLRGNDQRRTRYYDQRTGTLTTLPEDIVAYRESGDGQVVGALRYESDSPLQSAYFANRLTGRNVYCDAPGQQRDRAGSPGRCAYVDLVISLDGGASFAARRVNIPSGLSSIAPQRFEFAIVRGGRLYLGLYIYPAEWRQLCCRTADGSWTDRQGLAHTRQFRGDTLSPTQSADLGVLMMVLPGPAGQPLAAEQIPVSLDADALTGAALLDFDLGQPMPRLAVAPIAGPRPRREHLTRADRRDYVESLRNDYPRWAAAQVLDDLPSRPQWLTQDELRALNGVLPPLPEHPVDWVRLDRPPMN